MELARLLLCCVLLKIGAAITSDIVHRQDFSLDPNTVTTLDNNDPSFSTPIRNITVQGGRETVLSCTIRALGSYKVGWLRMADQLILSMGTKIASNPQKFYVTVENAKIKTNQTTGRNEDEASWRLHIRDVKESDGGCYMCQVNTTPMRSHVVCVDVLVPPDISASGTSKGDVIINEGENATLECNATGRPRPTVTWRREKNSLLRRDHRDQLVASATGVVGERLNLIKVDRKQMGAYLCLAKNDVPPGVSRRIYLTVQFPPTVKVQNELVGAPLGTNVSLICEIESSPKTINTWKFGEQVVSISSGDFESSESSNVTEEWKTTLQLTITNITKAHLGEYTCDAKSSLGTAQSTLRLYEIQVVTASTSATSVSHKKGGNYRERGGKLRMTTPKLQEYSRPSTPALSTSSLRPEKRKYLATTTANSRVPVTKDQHAFEHNEVFDKNNGLNVVSHCNIVIRSIIYLIIPVKSILFEFLFFHC